MHGILFSGLHFFFWDPSDADEWEGGETREIRHQSGTLARTDDIAESGPMGLI